MAEEKKAEVVDRKTLVYNLLTKNIKKTVSNMLSNVKDVDRYLLAAYNAACKNPDLLVATQASLVTCIVEAAQLSLDIGGPLGHAHLVPFYDGKKKCKVAQLVIGFRGYQELAYRTGRVSSFDIHPVYSKDTFRFCYGSNKNIEHVPCMEEDRGDLVAAYACVIFTNKGFDFEVVGPADAKRAAKSSKGAWYNDGNPNKNSPWHQPENVAEMWCKTAVRRLAKRLPSCAELELAAQYEASHDTEGVGPVIDVEDVEEPSAPEEPKSTKETVAEDLKAKAEQVAKAQAAQAAAEDQAPAIDGLDLQTARQSALDFWVKTGLEAQDAEGMVKKPMGEWKILDCRNIINTALDMRERMARAKVL